MAEIIEEDRPRVVILLGPTGVGKSKLVLELAEAFGGEILSADSMQVYRYMDIGTAKPTPEDQKRVRHHLIDLVTPDQPFHAALYRTLGRKTIDQLYKRGKPIWVVGGTGLGGGEGGLSGTIAGAVIVSMLNNILNNVSFQYGLQSSYYKNVLTGIILIIAMLIYKKYK